MSRRRHEAALGEAKYHWWTAYSELDAKWVKVRAENARLREAVALHRPDPEPVEIETFCDDPDGCDQWIEGLGCNGHFRDMLTCRECGAANVDGELGYREWPCSTVRAAGLNGEKRGP